MVIDKRYKIEQNQKMRSQHDAVSQCWFNVGPSSATLAQHWANTGSMYRFFAGMYTFGCDTSRPYGFFVAVTYWYSLHLKIGDLWCAISDYIYCIPPFEILYILSILFSVDKSRRWFLCCRVKPTGSICLLYKSGKTWKMSFVFSSQVKVREF